jgi:sulfonate transport system ATP-binding protein
MAAFSISIDVQRKDYVAEAADPVVRDIQIEIKPGEVFTFLGPSGCGKSTLLRLISGLDIEYAGQILVNGSRVRGPSRDIGVVFQESRLLPWYTVEQNVLYALDKRLPAPEKLKRVLDALALVGLGHAKNLFPKELSGGMARRVALARAVVNLPGVLLLDEPFSALDPLLRGELQDAVAEVVEKENLTAVLVTHDVEEAVYLSDRIAVLSKRPGRILHLFDVALPAGRERNSSAFLTLSGEVLRELFRGDRIGDRAEWTR